MWRAGILHRVEDLLALLEQNAASEDEIVASFDEEKFRNVAVRDVIAVARTGKWINSGLDGKLVCTDQGRLLLGAISAEMRMRIKVGMLLSVLNPPWAASIVQGRGALVGYAPPEAEQCFREAGLLDGHCEAVVRWWDELAARYREDRAILFVEIGRKGERLSFNYEFSRTGKEPEWTALEYADAGYDFVSRVSDSDSSRLVIEVKTSTRPWETAELFLSRAEWETLQQEPVAFLHLWSIDGYPAKLAVVAIDDLRTHVPDDQGSGVWHRMRCPFAAFAPIAVEVPDGDACL